MELMMYLPKVDDDTRIIKQRLIRLGATGIYGHRAAEDELLGMGKYIAGHLLNAWENPPPNDSNFTQYGFYQRLERIVTTMIEHDDLTLEQLQRYRRLITSEKKQ